VAQQREHLAYYATRICSLMRTFNAYFSVARKRRMHLDVPAIKIQCVVRVRQAWVTFLKQRTAFAAEQLARNVREANEAAEAAEEARAAEAKEADRVAKALKSTV
jgi:hypothetical protein